jgi:uncharacterized membrane protein HdeD (DUF308 family)
MYLLVIGILMTVAALTMRFPGWGWVVLSAIVAFILGVSIEQQWPVSGLWVIGLFIGIDMIFRGWSYVMLFLAARK